MANGYMKDTEKTQSEFQRIKCLAVKNIMGKVSSRIDTMEDLVI
jgi:hypothetical protein